MFKFIFSLGLLLLTQSSFSLSDKERLSPELSPGECASVPESKVYLPYLRSNHDGPYFKSVLSAIGENKINALNDSDSTHYYFCQVRCKSSSLSLRNDEEKETLLWVQHSDSPQNFNNQNGFLCKGVAVEMIPLVGSLKTLAPVVTAFSGFESNVPEIQQWFKENNFKMRMDASSESISHFKETMRTVSNSLIRSNSPTLAVAGAELLNYSQWTDESNRNLKTKILELSNNNWNFEKDPTRSNYFVNLMLNQYGRFLEYIEIR